MKRDAHLHAHARNTCKMLHPAALPRSAMKVPVQRLAVCTAPSLHLAMRVPRIPWAGKSRTVSAPTGGIASLQHSPVTALQRSHARNTCEVHHLAARARHAGSLPIMYMVQCAATLLQPMCMSRTVSAATGGIASLQQGTFTAPQRRHARNTCKHTAGAAPQHVVLWTMVTHHMAV